MIIKIGELSKFMPDSFKLKHTDIPWAEMRGLRNVEAHDYDNLDLAAVWKTIEKDIPDLKNKLQNVIK